jgi:hypothetical protein
MTYAARCAIRVGDAARRRTRFAFFAIAFVVAHATKDGERRCDPRRDDIVAISSFDRPRVIAALDEIISAFTVERALPGTPINHVAAIAAPNGVCIPTPIEPIITGIAEELIVANAAFEMVVIVAANEKVPFVATDQMVVA